MPELPEVETVARGLAKHLTGGIVETVHLHRRDMLHGPPISIEERLPGMRIQEIRRHGKQVWIHFEHDLVLAVHLGMTGRLIVTHRDQPLVKHTHLHIAFRERPEELRFIDARRFGGLWLLETRSLTVAAKRLAVTDKERENGGWVGRRLPSVSADPLNIPFAEFKSVLQRPRQIKALLLDQHPLSGIGNIYCDESLHRAGVHPLTRAIDLNDVALRRLWQALRRVLAAAIKAGGSSINDYRGADDNLGFFQFKHRVYDRAGEPCRNCRTKIIRILTAGRGTHLCPRCQRRLKPRAKTFSRDR